MLNKSALKAEMTRYGYTNKTMAKELGISSRTFSTRLATGDFGSKEIEILITKLHLLSPMEIFFCPISNLKVTNDPRCRENENQEGHIDEH